MEDFNLVLRGLINEDIKSIEVPENLKKEFEATGENYLRKDLILEAIKTFAITKNKEKLIKIGDHCINRKNLGLALKAFYYAQDKDGLSKTGMEFMKQGEIKKAFEVFKIAENKEMIEFLAENL